MTLILATGNPHKKREFSEIFSEHTILIPEDIGPHFDHEETGATFFANAHGKAWALWEELLKAGTRLPQQALRTDPDTGRTIPAPVIADDSGLCVSALDGRPGVYSARYGSDVPDPPQNDQQRNELLVRTMEGVANREAFYVCCMVLVIDDFRFSTVQETWHGFIAEEQSTGTGGFGYDPLFIVPELQKTVAEIPAAQKNRISHRGKAAEGIRRVLGSSA